MADLGTILTLLGTGAVGAAVLGLVGAGIARISEHRRWVRQERLEAYKSFLTITETYATLLRVPNALSHMDARSLSEEVGGGSAAILLLGPRRVSDAAERLRGTVMSRGASTDQATEEDVDESRAAFIGAARQVLRIDS